MTPRTAYTVPYGAGVQTIVYDPSTVELDIQGYADLWDASLVDSLAIIGNYRVINGMALKVLGESYNTEGRLPSLSRRAKSCWSWRPTSASSKTTTCRMTLFPARYPLRLCTPAR